MKIKSFSFFKVIFLGTFLSISVISTRAQQQKFTPYEELPAFEKILKPEYSDNMPDWGKMLYQYPVNFNQVNKAYALWEKENPGLKNALSRYYKLWRQHLETYVRYDGTIQMPDLKTLNESIRKAQSLAQQVRKAPAQGNSSNWTFLGPKQTFWLNESGSTTPPKACPWQVNVYSMDVTAANPNVVYAGTETGFVNKSIDKGQVWNLTGLGYTFGGGISAIAIHPSNPDTVYAAGGNTIHKSVDGGAVWARTAATFSANRLKIDYTNPNKLIASTDKGVYVSTDKAFSWLQKSPTECWDVEFKPNSPDTIYALSKSANFFRVIQSNNGGATFAEIPTFPSDIVQASGGLLAVTPNNPNILWVVMLSKNASAVEVPYLYKGTLANGVWTWALKYTGATGLSSSSGMTNGQGYFDLVLEVSPVNENIVFVGTTTLYKTINGGTTFTPVGGYSGDYSIHPDIQDMKMLSNGDTWVSTDGGMNLSTDNFTTQAKYLALNNGLIGSAMWGFDQGWNEDLIVGGRYHNGNTAIADFYGNKALRMGGGESPTGWLLHGKSRHAAFDDLGNGWILPKTAEGKPQGRFIFSKYPNMDQYGALRSNVLTHPNYSGTIYVGSENNLWISKDFGVTFELLYTFTGKIRYLNMSTSNPNVMYADIVGAGFYRTGLGGRVWVKTASASAPDWTGQMTFSVSPYNSEVVYASKQIGAWDNFSSEIYRSINGGASWTQWSALRRSIKGIVIQPTTDGKDLVYAATSSVDGVPAAVYYRKDGDAEWTTYSTNYPAGMSVISAVPFFRDGKLRIAGNAGVWESPLAEPEFTPVLVPWVDKKLIPCTLDTVFLDDHSYVNHQGASWNWVITPAPSYISNANSRNPKVLFDNPGKYSVTMNLTKNGVVYSKTMADMFEVKSCPSVNDCSNPGDVPKTTWKLISTDSYENGNEAAKAFDGNPSTIWHTAWSTTKAYPHEIQIDLGKSFNLSKMTYVPRTDGSNGRVKKYQLYVSNSKTSWGTAVKTDSLTNTASPTTFSFPLTQGQYVRFVALSEVNGNPWASAAEISFVGCNTPNAVSDLVADMSMKAFPVPTNSKITVTLPFNDGLNSYHYSVYAASGQQMCTGKLDQFAKNLSVDVYQYPTGYYFVIITDKNGISFRARFMKQ